MNLNRHLRASEDHAVLPFHPACPACRDERLSGRLPSTALVSPRLTALAVAGVTAGCVLTPAPGAMAQETPPALPPGGYEDPAEEAIEDEGPLEEDEPVESDEPDPNVPPVITDDPSAALDPSDPPPPLDPALLGGEPVPGIPVEDPPADQDVAAAPVPPTPDPPPPVSAAPAQPAPPPDQSRPGPSGEKPKAKPRSAPARARSRPESLSAPAPAAPSVSAPAPAGARYVVQPGDTLWSIASATLGAGAPVAKVAARVEAIWRANASAIRTGDPDLILPGTRLVIPSP